MGAWDIGHSRFDFNGDGSDDLLWENSQTGQMVVWDMNGESVLARNEAVQTSVPSPWKVVGTADINNDGHPDLLLWNTQTGQLRFWILDGDNGTQVAVQGSIFATESDTQWQPVSLADFNGDGRPDILWENSTTGQLMIWYMSGDTVLSTSTDFATIPTGCHVAGTADFLQNGHPDILLENLTTGQLAVWYLSGAGGTSVVYRGAPFAAVSNTEWRVVSTGDTDGDGHPDLTWENAQTGQSVVWLLGGGDGTTVEAGGGSNGAPSNTLPSPWNVVGVR
jgi:hypothetical protein